ncbi:hypothetical protein [Gracilimonas tropica]|uniref:hypothetical protein n=1 Tax=Gracilimonas tropica TaxID=454600 RepID=UPI0003636A45|nr:hypothetical protein [Gracilimonas tropica]
MNSTIKTKLFTNWHTMRWVALSVGIFLAVMAMWHKDIFTGFLSAFFVFQAVTNTGCMVAQSCGIPGHNEPASDQESEINYTEVK